jgi:predicted  nucleic acid-binding Zn-ribbon protein
MAFAMSNPSMAERLARLEQSHTNAVENAAQQRRDLIERIDNGNAHLARQIDDLRALLVEQNRVATESTASAAAAAAQANAAISDFTSKLTGAKLMVAGLIAIAGAVGGFVVKFLTWWQTVPTH